MTMRSAIDDGGKAPKVANLALNRETVQELTASEAETVAGGKRVTTLTANQGVCHSYGGCLSQRIDLCNTIGPCGTLQCTKGCPKR